MNVREVLNKQAAQCPQKPAIIFEARRITFSQLKDSAFRLANWLLGKGIDSKDKIATFMSNTPETIYSFLGTFSIGATIVPLDFMLTQEEVIHFLNHSEARLLITQPKKGVELNEIKTRCPKLKEIVVYKNEESTPWDSLIDAASGEPQCQINESDLSSIFYTSGSTGHPKGVMLNFTHFDNPIKTIDRFLGVITNDSYLCGGVPFSHLGGLDYIIFMLNFGSTLVLMERFHPLEFLKKLEEHKVTIFCIVPAMFMAILLMKEYDKFDLSSLRYAVVFGAPSSPQLLSRFHKAYPKATLLNGWGMTETAAPNAYSPPDESKLNSIGKFDFNMEAKLINQEGNEVTGSGQGELLVKGEGIMRGYYKEPEMTKEFLSEDGWFKTGDVVRRDQEGFHYIVGRKKDMIKVAGEIVFSPEVEEKIQRHPKVAEVAVIGVPDKLRGEVPKAFIVAKENEAIEASELNEFLRQNLAHFKIPHHIEFVKGLPRNRTGKIDKTKLVSQ